MLPCPLSPTINGLPAQACPIKSSGWPWPRFRLWQCHGWAVDRWALWTLNSVCILSTSEPRTNMDILSLHINDNLVITFMESCFISLPLSLIHMDFHVPLCPHLWPCLCSLWWRRSWSPLDTACSQLRSRYIWCCPQLKRKILHKSAERKGQLKVLTSLHFIKLVCINIWLTSSWVYNNRARYMT